MRPHRFEFNMDWRYWDISILKQLSFSHLRSLKVPLVLPFDCLELGISLASMHSLRSLTIADIPDDHEFIELLPFLGLGILSRGASLRELDLSVTNYNRPDQYCKTWERVSIEDEPFIKPRTYDHFFKALFPRNWSDMPESIQEHYKVQRSWMRNILKPKETVLGGLKFHKLRLKRMDLPNYTFTKIIDSSELTELRLPYCDVHPEVWASINSNDLEALEDIDYELLPRKFQDFLPRQPWLRSLSFRRPPDQYKSLGWLRLDGEESATQCFRSWRKPSPLGQGTEWGQQSCYFSQASTKYPTLDALLTTLSEATVENLVLPVDMFDISREVVLSMGVRLPYLEELTWGFDYNDEVIPAMTPLFEECC